MNIKLGVQYWYEKEQCNVFVTRVHADGSTLCFLVKEDENGRVCYKILQPNDLCEIES